MRLSFSVPVCLSVRLSVLCVICECENWVLCCAALGEVKPHSGPSMGATKLHSSNWIAVFYNQALVIPTPLEGLYELPLSLPWYAKPYPAKTQMVGLTKDTKHTYMKTLKGYVTLQAQKDEVCEDFWTLNSHPFLNRRLGISCFLSSFVCTCSVITWLSYAKDNLLSLWRQSGKVCFSNSHNVHMTCWGMDGWE